MIGLLALTLWRQVIGLLTCGGRESVSSSANVALGQTLRLPQCLIEVECLLNCLFHCLFSVSRDLVTLVGWLIKFQVRLFKSPLIISGI